MLFRLTFGNDIFDALAGAPGTYIHVDIHGNMSFGFSVDLYQFVARLPYVNGLAVNGWTYIIQDLGTTTVASGFLADKIDHFQQAQWLNAAQPGSVDAINSGINDALLNMQNNGLNMSNISLPKIISQVIENYVQENGLGDDWFTYFQNYFLNLGVQLPKNPGQGH